MIAFVNLFPAHFFIEALHNHEIKRTFLSEEVCGYEERLKTDKAFRLFDGIDYLKERLSARCITASLKGYKKFRTDPECTDFIKNVVITLSDTKECIYLPEESEFDEEGNFATLTMRMGRHSDSLNVYHELINVYGAHLQEKHKGEKCEGCNGVSWKMMRDALSHLDNLNDESYLQQIAETYKRWGDSYNSVTALFEDVKNELFYKSYLRDLAAFTFMCNSGNETEQDYIMDEVSDYTDVEFNSYEDFGMWMREKVMPYMNEFNAKIPRLILENVKLCGYLSPAIADRIKDRVYENLPDDSEDKITKLE